MKIKKSKIKKSKNKKTKIKKSKIKKSIIKSGKKDNITLFKQEFSKDELDIILKNNLISPNNINKSDKEILLDSGIILKSTAGILYFSYDPLQILSESYIVKMLYLLSPCFSTVLNNIYKENKFIEDIINKNFKRYLVFFDIKTEIG